MENSKFLLYLQKQTPFSKDVLYQIIESAPTRYKNHYIRKRNNRGVRLISQPTREVKLLQKEVIDLLAPFAKVHNAATAYRKGKSIKDHAAPHAVNKYLLKLDFKDFFPSIDHSCLRYCIKKLEIFNEDECEIIIKILCRLDQSNDTPSLKLSIGAPSSPFISNFVMYEFDEIINSFCAKNNAVYTRYADDIAISCSTPKLLDRILEFIKATLVNIDYLRIILNENKTVNISRKNKRFLVGIVLGNSGLTSVGRDKKRKIRATLHRASQGLLSINELNELRGRLSYYLNIDKDFVIKLLDKYDLKSPSDIKFDAKENNFINLKNFNIGLDDNLPIPF